jgi:hypothetical protein
MHTPQPEQKEQLQENEKRYRQVFHKVFGRVKRVAYLTVDPGKTLGRFVGHPGSPRAAQ